MERRSRRAYLWLTIVLWLVYMIWGFVVFAWLQAGVLTKSQKAALYLVLAIPLLLLLARTFVRYWRGQES